MVRLCSGGCLKILDNVYLPGSSKTGEMCAREVFQWSLEQKACFVRWGKRRSLSRGMTWGSLLSWNWTYLNFQPAWSWSFCKKAEAWFHKHGLYTVLLHCQQSEILRVFMIASEIYHLYEHTLPTVLEVSLVVLWKRVRFHVAVKVLDIRRKQ